VKELLKLAHKVILTYRPILRYAHNL